MLKKRLKAILLWSVISAAFIGPGTLATATAAGSQFGFSLIWALVFSTFACLIIQEMVARLAIVNQKDLGELLFAFFDKRWVPVAVGSSVILGCIAYEAGNILGAVSGLELVVPFGRFYITLFLVVICLLVLLTGKISSIVRLLGYLVAGMSLVFLYLAIQTPITTSGFLESAVVPKIESGAALIVLGLIGTTIVPYNLYLGGGLGKNQQITPMRWGLSISVLLGGLVSIAILIVATQLDGKGEFYDVAVYLQDSLGDWAYYFMAFGLFAAGITSSLTAPLAGGMIGQSIFQRQPRITKVFWLAIFLTGALFGLLEVKPIPMIIAAQALNGLVLPGVVYCVLLLINNPRFMTQRYRNGIWLNVIGLLILNIVLLLGFNNLFSVAYRFYPLGFDDVTRLILFEAVALTICSITAWQIFKAHREE